MDLGRKTYSNGVINWLQTIVEERFGHIFQLVRGKKRGALFLSLPDTDGMIELDCFGESFWKKKQLPYTVWDASSEGWKPVLGKTLPAPGGHELPSPLIEKGGDGLIVHYDVLGLTYWMLSRMEEVGCAELDEHDRFPATSSHAFKHGYLDRPVVDEWFDILRQVILCQWPELELRHPIPKTFVSCDVDTPYLCYCKSFKSTIRVMAGDLLKRRSFKAARETLQCYMDACRGDYSRDPNIKAIDWIMEVNEREGNSVAFYFIPENLDDAHDGCYSLDEPILRELIRKISERGHEIGYHASYLTYRDATQTCRETEILRNVIEEEGILQAYMGGRQHYLRYAVPTTADNWEAAGLNYDSSLGYADRPGFRCGTCFDYQMIDPIKGRTLKLRQRPLVLMECSVLDDSYMGMGHSVDALEYMKLIKKRCFLVGGFFTLLWHNSNFKNIQEKKIYSELIK